MATKFDGDDLLQSLSDQFNDFIEVESISKVRNDLKVIKRLNGERSELLDRSAVTTNEFDSLVRTTYGLPGTGDLLMLFRDKLEKTRLALNEKNDELSLLKAQKYAASKKIKEANADHAELQNVLAGLDEELANLNVSKERTSYRLISALMATVYKFDKEGRCISIVLDEKQRVENAVMVDKENKPEDVSKDLWAQLEKSYDTINIS